MLVRQTPAEATSPVQQSRVEFLMFCPRLFASLSTFFYVTKFSHYCSEERNDSAGVLFAGIGG